MCTEPGVWTMIVEDSVMPTLAAVFNQPAACILNLWAPHGFDQAALLAAVAAAVHDTQPQDRILPWGIGALSVVRAALEQPFTHRAGVADAPAAPDVATQAAVRTDEQRDYAGLILGYGVERLLGTADFFKVEELLLARFHAGARLVLVLATNLPVLPWGASELWQITHNIQIGPLSHESVQRLAQTCSRDPAAAWTDTFGYVPALAEWLQEPDTPPATIIDRILAATFAPCSPRSQRLAALAGLLPFFNVAVLRTVTDVAENDDSYAQYSLAINELQSLGIITWDLEAGWYRFTDGALRRLIAARLAATEPTTAATLRERALQYFAADARRDAFLQYSFVSTIFHLAANSSAGADTTTELCLNWIQRSQPNWRDVDWYAVLHTWQNGGGDWQVRDELESRLGAENYTRITKAIVEARSQSNEQYHD